MSAGQNKNAKLEEAGGEWELQPFGQILKEPVRNGIYKPKEFHGRGVKIVNMGELFAYPRLHSVPMKRVFLSDSEKKRFMLSTGDLLFARRSLVAEGAGKCSIVLELDEPATYESSIIRARPDNNKIESLFLYYFFNSVFGLHCLDTIRRQVAVAGITGNDLARLEIPIPPLEEQRAIAHILGTLDDKIELNRRTNETLEAMAQALFKFWFVDFGPVRAKMEGRWRRGQSLPGLPAHLFDLFPDRLVDSELGEIPEGWEVVKVSDIGKIVCGKTPSTKIPEYYGIDISFITIPDMHNNIFATTTQKKLSYLGANSQKNKTLPPNTICVSCIATPGLVIITTENSQTNQQINSVILDELNEIYYWFWIFRNLNNIIKASGSGGSVLINLSTSRFSELRILSSAKKLRQLYHLCIMPFFERVLMGLQENITLTILRDTLLPKLISGELRVRK